MSHPGGGLVGAVAAAASIGRIAMQLPCPECNQPAPDLAWVPDLEAERSWERRSSWWKFWQVRPIYVKPKGECAACGEVFS